MSKWCETCHRNKATGIWASCEPSCPVFGKDFEELAEMVVTNLESKSKLDKVKGFIKSYDGAICISENTGVVCGQTLINELKEIMEAN